MGTERREATPAFPVKTVPCAWERKEGGHVGRKFAASVLRMLGSALPLNSIPSFFRVLLLLGVFATGTPGRLNLSDPLCIGCHFCFPSPILIKSPPLGPFPFLVTRLYKLYVQAQSSKTIYIFIPSPKTERSQR